MSASLNISPPAFEGLRWKTITCPRCAHEIEIHVLRLAATCRCGLYFVDIAPFEGWYESLDAFMRGDQIIAEIS